MKEKRFAYRNNTALRHILRAYDRMIWKYVEEDDSDELYNNKAYMHAITIWVEVYKELTSRGVDYDFC